MDPDISVVIASINGINYLKECLTALRKQQASAISEVVVADCVGKEVTEYVHKQHPEVKLISFRERQSVAKLRAEAIKQARGKIIAITEDHCIPPPDWTESILRAHAANPAPAIGGAVDNGATKSLIDWAVFFCEYSNFISPVTDGIVHDLPGPNVSYKREALWTLPGAVRDEFWETAVHGKFEDAGQQLWSTPSIKMIHKKHFGLIDFIVERFHYSKAFAGARKDAFPPAKRVAYFFGSMLLPPILFLRIFKRVSSKGRNMPQFILAVPVLMLFMVVWAFGESVGYVLGPGDSALYLS